LAGNASHLTGLNRMAGRWIEKEIRGYGRIRESIGARDLERAAEVLNHELNEVRKAKQFGVRPTRTFREAATFYLESNGHKRSLDRDAQDLRSLDPFIGDLALPQVHMGTLAGWRCMRSTRVAANRNWCS
jgi:hypothetical protein